MNELLQQSKPRSWLLFVGVATLLIGSSYAIVQQSTRLAANDLPLSTAQTAYHELTGGAAPSDVVPKVKTDLSSDSTVFMIITDNSQDILASSAQLNGQTPLPPAGVFSYTKTHSTDSFTWQPVSNVRLATRVMPYGSSTNGGFIITGQSLQQAENRINTYSEIALAGWAGIVAWTTFLLWLPARSKKLKKQD